MTTEENWFGTRLRAQRGRAGLTQQALADRMDVSLQSVREWERGVMHPALERLPLLARVLGVPAGSLFPDADVEPPAGSEGMAPPRIPVDERLSRIERQLDALLAEVRRLRDARDLPQDPAGSG